MRDAIVYGYDWAGASAVERIALALARAGAKVLHCDRISSLLRRPDTRLRELESNLYTFKPWVLPSRLNRLPRIPGVQAGIVTRQILGHARALQMENPLFVYAWAGTLLHPLCETMRRHGCTLVHVFVDYLEAMEQAHVEQSDLTLVFSRTAYHRLRARWDEKIHLIPHGVDLLPFQALHACSERIPPLLASIPGPLLGYAGGFAGEHLNTRVLRALLERHPEWSFVSFEWKDGSRGRAKAIALPNAHTLPWQGPAEFARCVAAFDVGFMPYDCSNLILYNGPPMKLWDYFALGLPVVATPIVHLWEYEDLVYLGETVQELELAVERALAEPADSPRRKRRMELAAKHSVEALGETLQALVR